MDSQRINWIDALSWQIDFSSRHGYARRTDPEFEWAAFERRSVLGRFEVPKMLAQVVRRVRRRPAVDLDWIRANSEPLWSARQLISDDLSRLLFDQVLVLRSTSHRRFYFPRIDFDDLLVVGEESDFTNPDFPHDYLGVPLKVFDVSIHGRNGGVQMKVITRQIQLRLMNSYRQYLVRRGGIHVAPGRGDVVLDCGACIGEVSMLFAGLASPAGQVHLFDPLPLHARFCRLQVELNPAYSEAVFINELAVGGESREARSERAAGVDERIVPDATDMAGFACTTIDHYARSLSGVDFIKMDIEGAEMEALSGAASVVQEFRPRLAISGYHRPEDLWEIPLRLKQLNPDYQLAFGHHTPVSWESVFYAMDPRADVVMKRGVAEV